MALTPGIVVGTVLPPLIGALFAAAFLRKVPRREAPTIADDGGLPA